MFPIEVNVSTDVNNEFTVFTYFKCNSKNLANRICAILNELDHVGKKEIKKK
jgi:hypothetical protein